ncbi:hypothetical protein MTR67_051797 [Solanum verrucosum]|uniref:Reverse transcriptase domain-containing protein n=1 Tax=Solanum verrucosum TaxID=315347 RepID=A0AAF0ZZF5_SOLVR|nr:hypothetical protein MTR67_051797 [Solanum verrucosum]
MEKAAGPDGVPMVFFLWWEMLKEDIITTVQFFHSNQVFERSFNATIIALIPNKIGAVDLLKNVVSKVMNKHHMDFIKGRQVIDATLIASECVDSRTRGVEPGVMCKLDIQKANGHVFLEFLCSILRQMGFDSFDGMMTIALHNRWFKGFQISGRGWEEVEITHLLYANDAVIFCEPKAEQICYIRLMLMVFEVVTGLRVNWSKNSLFPVKEVPHIKEPASILGCVVENLPTIYLGMPLGRKHKALEIWDGILGKTEKKLAWWKAQYLSLGGNFTLINYMLDSFLTNVMPLFPNSSIIVTNLTS